MVAAKPTKEERQEARAKRDAKVPVIRAIHIQWVPSAFSIAAQKALLEEQQRRLDKADTPRLRNMVRSEIRATKAHLARAHVTNGKKPWSTETFHTKQMCVLVFISPKKHRYVLADKDGPADLLIANRKRAVVPFTRLVRFEKSRFARMKKLEKQDDVKHEQRRTVKRKARAEKRLKRQS